MLLLGGAPRTDHRYIISIISLQCVRCEDNYIYSADVGMNMVNTFSLKRDIVVDGTLPHSAELFKAVRDRTIQCRVPTCWELKDPKDQGSIFLPHQFFNSRRGRQVQLRQVLFQLIYGEPAPIGRSIRMACGNKRCVNPMHMKVTGWSPPWGIIEKYIGVGWINRTDAEQYYGVNK
jgi:hypothetical protein